VRRRRASGTGATWRGVEVRSRRRPWWAAGRAAAVGVCCSCVVGANWWAASHVVTWDDKMDVDGGAVEAGAVHLLERLFSFVLGLVNNVGRAAVAVVGVVHEQVDVDYLTKVLKDFVKVGGRDVLGQFLDDNLIVVSGRAGINADTAVAEGGFKRSLQASCSRTLDERGVGETLRAGLHVLRRPRTSRSISTSLERL